MKHVYIDKNGHGQTISNVTIDTSTPPPVTGWDFSALPQDAALVHYWRREETFGEERASVVYLQLNCYKRERAIDASSR